MGLYIVELYHDFIARLLPRIWNKFLCNFHISSAFTLKSKFKSIGLGINNGINYLLHIVLLTLFLKIGVSEELVPIPVFAIAIPVNFMLARFVFKSGEL